MVGHATLALKITRADGTVEDKGIVSRKKVTRAWVNDLVDAMCDAAGSGALATFNDYIYHGAGTGTTGEANTDTDLETDTGETRGTGTRVDNSTAAQGIYQSVGVVTFTGAHTIAEHGLFNAITGGTLLDRSVHAGQAVNSGDTATYTYIVTLDPEA